MEQEAAEVGVQIKSYHSDNGVFRSDEFKDHCASLGQKTSFSGVGAKFQNGVAERNMQTVCNMARANMLHATLCWPGSSFVYGLWPCHTLSGALTTCRANPPIGHRKNYGPARSPRIPVSNGLMSLDVPSMCLTPNYTRRWLNSQMGQ